MARPPAIDTAPATREMAAIAETAPIKYPPIIDHPPPPIIGPHPDIAPEVHAPNSANANSPPATMNAPPTMASTDDDAILPLPVLMLSNSDLVYGGMRQIYGVGVQCSAVNGAYLKPASTMNAMNSAVRYGLENLNKVHDAFSLGFTRSQMDMASIAAPNTPAVTR